jgi:transposase-like protein
MKRHRRKHTAEFKARVALEALKGIKTASEIAHEYEIHPVMVSKWKKELISRMPELFDEKNKPRAKDTDKEQEQLHRKVGQLTMEVDFLEKKCRQLGIPVKGRNS